ncbi:MAG TPA: PorP/SprF family type IX secretion system membrane protein [Ohtaekwangia sp.]
MKFRSTQPWKIIGLLILIVQGFSLQVLAQGVNESMPFHGYYYDLKLINPAFTAWEDPLNLTTMFSGQPFNPDIYNQKFFFSYEAILENTNSGMGGLFNSGEWGPQRQRGTSLFYRYKFNLNPQSDLRIGTQLSYNRITINYTYLPIDPGDPLIPGGFEKLRAFNADLGIAYHSPWITMGVSMKNILEQKIAHSDTGKTDYSSVNIMATRKFTIAKDLLATPSVFFVSESEGHRIDFNCSFEIKNWIIIGGGYQLYRYDTSDESHFTLNTGLNVKDHVQFILHVYSSAYQEYRDEYSGKNTFMEAMLRFRILADSSEDIN